MKEFKVINGNKVEFRIPKGTRIVVREAKKIDMSLERLVAPSIPTHPQDDYNVIEIYKN